MIITLTYMSVQFEHVRNNINSVQLEHVRNNINSESQGFRFNPFLPYASSADDNMWKQGCVEM